MKPKTNLIRKHMRRWLKSRVVIVLPNGMKRVFRSHADYVVYTVERDRELLRQLVKDNVVLQGRSYMFPVQR